VLQGSQRTMRLARQPRGAMSLPEVILWTALRKRPAGLKFRRQHPSGPYVADFYCHAARLIVEIDGAAHGFGDRPERDAVRDAWFEARGLAVLRIAAREVLDDSAAVVQAVVSCAAARLRDEE
jgi:very-short-patch-repair endonuclease